MLSDAIERTLTMVRGRLEQSNIHLTTDYHKVAPVLANPDQLQQIFLNLIMNMIDAIEEDDGSGQLKIIVYPKDDDVSISFTNSGPAIPSDVLPHIFEPFITTKSTGNGLGLWVCHKLVKQNNGELTAENLSERKGVVFTIKFRSTPFP